MKKILSLRKQKSEDRKFKIILGYLVSLRSVSYRRAEREKERETERQTQTQTQREIEFLKRHVYG